LSWRKHWHFRHRIGEETKYWQGRQIASRRSISLLGATIFWPVIVALAIRKVAPGISATADLRLRPE
jgi:hypothetical protein